MHPMNSPSSSRCLKAITLLISKPLWAEADSFGRFRSLLDWWIGKIQADVKEILSLLSSSLGF